jgi:hypothetical protein
VLPQFTDHEVEIIEEITITLAMILGNCIREYKNPKKMMGMYSKISPSEKSQMRVFMSLSLRNMSHQEDQIKEILTKISMGLFEESRGVFHNSRPRLSKLLKEFETAGIILSIEGKKKIKKESPKSIPRKPKIGKERREAYPIAYKMRSIAPAMTRIVLQYPRLAEILIRTFVV